MAEKRLFKEYNHILKHHPNHTNHQILSLVPINPEEDIFHWEAVICKPSKSDSKYYYNGQWKLLISVGRQYPIAPPTIRFDKSTPISHPNINFETGEICLDILKSDNWSPAWNLEHLIVAILMLIDDPEPDSPYNIDLANLYRSDPAAFESFVQFIIWKYNTFYENDKDLRGVKNGVEIEEEEEEQQQQQRGQQQNDDSDDYYTTTTTTLPVHSQTNSHQREESEPNVDIIKDVGKQITQEFIDKVDEIKHSKESSLDEGETSNYSNAKRQIVENVNKQVEELCSKSVSPVNEPTTLTQEVEELKIDPLMEDERKKFLKEVDLKVNSYQQRNKSNMANSEANSVNTAIAATADEDDETSSKNSDNMSKHSKPDAELSSVSTNSSLNRLKKSLSIKTDGPNSNGKKKSKRDRFKKMVSK